MLSRSAAWLAAAALLLMALVGVTDILMVTLFGAALPGAVELSESLLTACVFLPMAWTQRHGGQVSMGFLRARLGQRGRPFLDLFTNGCTLFFFGILAWQGWVFAWRSLIRKEYAAGLIAFPLFPGKIALALGLSLFVAVLAGQTVSATATIFRRKERHGCD